MKKNNICKVLLAVAMLVLMASCATAPKVKDASAAGSGTAEITAINFKDNGLTIACSQSFTYTLYTTDDPYRITIEIPDMSLGKFRGKMVSDKTGISEIVPHQIEGAKPGVKIDVVLQTPSSVVPIYKDNVLTFMVKAEEPVLLTEAKETPERPDASVAAGTGKKEGNSAEASSAAETKGTATEAIEQEPRAAAAEKKDPASPVMPKATEITRIELKKSSDALRVLIRGNGSMSPDVFPLKGRIVVDIPDVSMHASVPTSVVSPLKGIRAGKHKDKIRIVLDLKERTDFDVAASGDSVEVALRREGQRVPTANAEVPGPAPVAAAPGKEIHAETSSGTVSEQGGRAEMAMPGQNTSPAKVAGETEVLHTSSFKNGEARCDEQHIDKKISLDFQDAEIGPIFRLLADVNGCNLVLDPSVKGKTTIKLMNVPWHQALEIILNNASPPLSYRIQGNILWVAPVSKFDSLVQEKKKLRETEENAEPLIQEVVRVNYAQAGDLSAAITQGKLLSQRGFVTIDSRMNTLIIKDTKTSVNKIKDLVKLMDVAKPQVMIEAKLVEVSDSYTKKLGIRWGGNFFAPVFPNVLGGDFSVNTPTLPAGPAAAVDGGTLNMTVGSANTFKINMSLSALETVGQSKTLSNPKVLTMDGEAATIQQGTTFFISTVSQAGTQTQQQQATLSLTVTPKITPDGYVQLKVTATDNSLEPGTSGDTAIVDTKSLTTQALVKNGETLVLGGIYRFDKTVNETGVPLLSRIPVLGWLFKTKEDQGPNVKELLIFITPNIVEQKT